MAVVETYEDLVDSVARRIYKYLDIERFYDEDRSAGAKRNSHAFASPDEEQMLSDAGIEDFADSDRRNGVSHASPAIVENKMFPQTVIHYFGQLTAFPMVTLLREPKRLEAEEARVTKEIEAVALKHYKIFVRGSHSVFFLSRQAESLQQRLQELNAGIDAFHRTATAVRDEAETLTSRRKLLTTLVRNRGIVAKILSAGSLLDTCLVNEMFNECLTLLEFIQTLASRIAALEEKGNITQTVSSAGVPPETPVASRLYNFHGVQVDRVHRVLLRRFQGSLDIPACTAIVGYLRRLEGMRGSRPLSAPVFGIELSVLARLAVPVESLKRQTESMFREDPLQAMIHAAEMLETHVAAIATTFIQLFNGDGASVSIERHLYSWLTLQIDWFFSGLLQLLDYRHLTDSITPFEVEQHSTLQPFMSKQKPPVLIIDADETTTSNNCIDEYLDWAAFTPSTDDIQWFHQHRSHGWLDLSKLRSLYCHTWDASYALARLRCGFVAMTTNFFNTYLQRFLRVRLHMALLEFQTCCLSYNWDVPTGKTEINAAENCVDTSPDSLLERHAPLTQLINHIIMILNDFRLCALEPMSKILSSLLTAMLVAAIVPLREAGQLLGVLDSESRRLGYWAIDIGPPVRLITHNAFYDVSRRRMAQSEEYFLMCWVFAKRALPLLSRYIKTIYSDADIHEDVILQQLHGLLIPSPVSLDTNSSKHEMNDELAQNSET